MTFHDKKLLIFDLDGTLIDSASDLALALNMTLEALAMPTFSEETIRAWIGNGAQTLVKRGLSGSKEIDPTLCADLFDKALESFLGHYHEHVCVRTTMYPQVKETLEALHDKGFRLTLATNKPINFVRPILEHFQLEDIFEFSIGGDCLKVKKPDPAPLLHVCEQCNVLPRHCLMIGDSKNDILAAKGADMDVIAVNYGYNHDEDIAIYQPDHIIEEFSHLLHALKGA